MAYATVENVSSGFRELDSDEQSICTALLDEAAVVIDAFAASAGADVKRVVSCRMVRRAIGNAGGGSAPIGATQGSIGAGGYTQSWQFGSGSAGELYLSRIEKQLLGTGNQIGAASPLELYASTEAST